MNTKDFTSLAQFLGGYFHQDWVDEFSTYEDAIAAFKNGEPAEYISFVCEELERTLLLIRGGAEDPERVLKQLGCYYNPTAAGLCVADWFEKIQEQLQCK